MERRSGLLTGLALVLALALVGCGPSGTPTETPTPSPSTAPPTEEPTPEPTETEEPVSQDIALPAACEEVFSSAFITQLEDANYPLNHPDVGMPPTQLIAGQSALASVPALHCTWGAPSETGITTVVAVVSQAQSDAIRNEAVSSGFTCGAPSDVEYRCVIEEVDETSELGTMRWGEQHVFRGNAWIGTAWLNFDMFGYTDHIVSQLWP